MQGRLPIETTVGAAQDEVVVPDGKQHVLTEGGDRSECDRLANRLLAGLPALAVVDAEEDDASLAHRHQRIAEPGHVVDMDARNVQRCACRGFVAAR